MEIEFRGKRETDGKWIYSTGIMIQENFGTAYLCAYYDTDKVVWHSVQFKTVGQFTGVFDDNYNKIYEGDIVRITINDIDEDIVIEKPVIFKNGAFLVDTEIQIVFGMGGLCVEVIGNIYDNPELLEGNDDEH